MKNCQKHNFQFFAPANFWLFHQFWFFFKHFRKSSSKWVANLHMDGRNFEGTNQFGTRSEPRIEEKRDLFRFCGHFPSSWKRPIRTKWRFLPLQFKRRWNYSIRLEYIFCRIFLCFNQFLGSISSFCSICVQVFFPLYEQLLFNLCPSLPSLSPIRV